MVRKILMAAFFFVACGGVLSAQERKITLNEAQSRLFRYSPIEIKEIDSALADNEFLVKITSDTWGFFYDCVDRETGLPIDNISKEKVNLYTSITNIGLYMMCVVGAHDLKIIDRDLALERLNLALSSLEKMEKWEGNFFNYYWVDTLEHSGSYISAVDNGWLAAGLIVAKQSFPDEIGQRCKSIFDAMNFKIYYDAKLGHLSLGFEGSKKKASAFHYGMLCTEPRLTSYIAIAKGDVPVEHWFRLNRTLPRQWKWQQQPPRGGRKVYSGYKVFQGYYKYKDFKFVPSWGGSMFEFLMPALVLNEKELSSGSFAPNNKTAVDLQIFYALEENGYPVWGMSPCSIPGDPEGYAEYGVKHLGAKGYPDEHVVTPHATFLALEIEPEKAIKNLKELLKYSNIYGTYGFFDSLNFETGQVNNKYLCLDQAMSFIALCNYLNDGAIKKKFHSDPTIKKYEHLLTVEEFF